MLIRRDRILARALAFFQPELPILVVVCGIQFLATGLDLLSPWPLKLIVDGVFSNGAQAGRVSESSLMLKHWLGWMSQQQQVVVLCACMAAISLGSGLLGYWGKKLAIRGGLRAVLQFRTELFEALQYAPLQHLDTTHSTDSTYRVAYDAQSLQTMYNGVCIPLITSGFTLIGAVAIMIRLNLTLTLVSVLVIPFVFWALRIYIDSIELISTQRSESDSLLLRNAQEVLGSARHVRAYSMEAQEVQRFRGTARSNLEANYRFNKVQMKSGLAVSAVVSTGTAILYMVGFLQIVGGSLTLGSVLVFVNYLTQLYAPVQYLSGTVATWTASRASFRRCLELIDGGATTGADVATASAAPIHLSRKPAIDIRDLRFGYSDETLILDGINLSIQPGEFLAIVGPTGQGKSTFLSLIAGFYKPQSGRILIDQQDIQAHSGTDLRRHLSLIMQDTVLFTGSIAENIGYGRPGASRDQIVAAARLAEADGFISALDSGYDTLIGEGGVRLSGGQRQRLSIARAFLRDTPILLLDEPTSSLDTKTEATITQALLSLAAGRTTVLVTHRLPISQQADRVVVLQHQRIVECGRPADLIIQGGHYADLMRASSLS